MVLFRSRSIGSVSVISSSVSACDGWESEIKILSFILRLSSWFVSMMLCDSGD